MEKVVAGVAENRKGGCPGFWHRKSEVYNIVGKEVKEKSHRPPFLNTERLIGLVTLSPAENDYDWRFSKWICKVSDSRHCGCLTRLSEFYFGKNWLCSESRLLRFCLHAKVHNFPRNTFHQLRSEQGFRLLDVHDRLKGTNTEFSKTDEAQFQSQGIADLAVWCVGLPWQQRCRR